jgi:hypothetical protein
LRLAGLRERRARCRWPVNGECPATAERNPILATTERRCFLPLAHSQRAMVDHSRSKTRSCVREFTDTRAGTAVLQPPRVSSIYVLKFVNAKLCSDRPMPKWPGKCSTGFRRPVRLWCATPPSSSGTPGAVSVGRTAVFAVSPRKPDVFASRAKQSRAVARRVGIASSRGRSSRRQHVAYSIEIVLAAA